MTRFIVAPLFLITSVLAFGCGTGGIGGGSSGDDVQYAALGASDAVGIGASSFTKGYVYLIEEGIEDAGSSTNLMNYGVPDIQSGGIRDVELELLDLGNTPDVVTIFTGGNDIIDGAESADFESDLNSILNHLRKIEGVKIFIADLPDLTLFPRFRDRPDSDVTVARVQEFNRIIAQQAMLFGAQVIALSSEPVDENTISDDGFHPNDAGYRRIADLFLQEILPRV
jgi:acyl-CoA thioesterase-1